jgi:hypothetical protein
VHIRFSYCCPCFQAAIVHRTYAPVKLFFTKRLVLVRKF